MAVHGLVAAMGILEEIERKLWSLIDAADWDDLVPRLQAYVRAYLSQYGESEKRRWQTVTQQYVTRTVQVVLERGAESARWHEWNTLFELLSKIAAHLIDDDERRLKQLLEGANWTDIIPRVIAHTVRQLGPRPGPLGMTPEDYVYEAVVQLFTRQRHFPVDRDVSLFTFLCKTVHGMRTNELASLVAKSPHVPTRAAGDDENEAGVEPVASSSTSEQVAVSITLEKFVASLEPDLRRYALLRASEIYGTAQEYAKALGVSIETIRNYDKRLRRRRQRWNA